MKAVNCWAIVSCPFGTESSLAVALGEVLHRMLELVEAEDRARSEDEPAVRLAIDERAQVDVAGADLQHSEVVDAGLGADVRSTHWVLATGSEGIDR